jgi:hypothetical protein
VAGVLACVLGVVEGALAVPHLLLDIGVALAVPQRRLSPRSTLALVI